VKRALLLLLTAAACERQASAPTATEKAGNVPADIIAYDIQHTMTAEGVRRIVLFGDSAYQRPADPDVDVMGVRLTFYSDAGTKTGDLTSRTGEYNLTSGTMVARGTVVLNVLGEAPRRVESEELHFDLKGDRIWSDKPTTMRQGASVLRGNSFRSDTRFQNLTVSNARSSGPPPRDLAQPAPSTGGGMRF
jgi:LPS export ABC transporter protein LptC